MRAVRSCARGQDGGRRAWRHHGGGLLRERGRVGRRGGRRPGEGGTGRPRRGLWVSVAGWPSRPAAADPAVGVSVKHSPPRPPGRAHPRGPDARRDPPLAPLRARGAGGAGRGPRTEDDLRARLRSRRLGFPPGGGLGLRGGWWRGVARGPLASGSLRAGRWFPRPPGRQDTSSEAERGVPKTPEQRHEGKVSLGASLHVFLFCKPKS